MTQTTNTTSENAKNVENARKVEKAGKAKKTKKPKSAARRAVGDVMRRRVAPSVLAVFLKIYAKTLRIEKRGDDLLNRLKTEYPDTGVIFAMWHGPHIPILIGARDRGYVVITSKSADGDILTRILEKFGFQTVRGSSSRGGVRALVDLARLVKAGHHVALAVDGPRGPIYEAKAGAVLLAKLTGAPIIVSTGSVSKFKEFGSWDRFRLPRPFTRGICQGGPDILLVPKDADDAMIEAKRIELQDLLNKQQRLLDEETGATQLLKDPLPVPSD